MDLLAVHWIYLVGIVFIVLTMLARKNVVVPAIVMTFIVGLFFTGSLLSGIQTVFSASLVAAGELFNIFLIIAIMTALLRSLDSIGANEQMIRPFSKVMKNATASYTIILVVTYGISLFFWPTPAVANVSVATKMLPKLKPTLPTGALVLVSFIFTLTDI